MKPRATLFLALLSCVACAKVTSSDRPTQGEQLIDEIGGHFRATRRWFGMVHDLEFTRSADGSLTPRFETLRSSMVRRPEDTAQTLTVRLPAVASGDHVISLPSSPGVWIRARESGVAPSAAELARGVVIYPAAVAGGDLLYKLTPTHVDEYVYLRNPPPVLTRRVTIAHGPDVTELREVTGFVEVLDRDGTARLRVGAPLARGADGTRRRGTVRVQGDTLTFEVDLRGLVAPVLVDPDWSTTGTMTVGHWANGVWTQPDGKVVVIAGCSLSGCPTSFARPACGQVLADTEVWSGATGTWTAGRPLTTARFAFGTAPLPPGDVLVAGGCTEVGCTAFTAETERFRTATGAWTSAGQLSRARANLATAVLRGGDALAIGGCDGTACVNTVERYQAASNTWSPVASLTTARGFATATELPDGRVLVLGGCSDPGCSNILASAEVYDPTTDRWSAAGTLTEARAAHSATLLQDGTVLVAGGCADLECRRTLPTTELWSDASGGAFRMGPVMPGARHNHTATALPTGEVLVAGGANGATTSIPAAEAYVPRLGTWIPLEAMHLDRAYHVAAILPGSNVLLAGGCNPATCMPWAEVFNPARLLAIVAADGGVPDAGPTDASVTDASRDVPSVDAPPPVAESPHPALYRNGVTRCAVDSEQELACPIASHPLQDGDFQPNAHPLQAGAAGELVDPVTGLTWQATENPGRFTQAGAAAFCRSLATPGAPAGSWRLPNVVELYSINHAGTHLPSLDERFVGAESTNYWTSTPVASGEGQFWTVRFDFGEVIPLTTSRTLPVRCVRGGDAGASRTRRAGTLVADGETVRDEETGLEWQRHDDGVRRSWADSLTYCANLRLAGKTGWHLPTVTELDSIVEYGSAQYVPGTATTDPVFNNARPDLYWTATPNSGAPTLTWSVSFNLGVVDGVTVTGVTFARCVRHLATPAPPSTPAPESCGCRAGSPEAPTAWLLALAAALSLRRRNRARKAG